MNWHLAVSSTEEREKILKDTATLGPWYQSFNLADWLKIQAVHDGDSVLDCLDVVDVRDGQIEFRRKEARVAAAGG